MPLELAGGYGQAMSKPQRHRHREPSKEHASIATHREGLVTILGNLASGASKVVGEDLRVARCTSLSLGTTGSRDSRLPACDNEQGRTFGAVNDRSGIQTGSS